MWIIWHVYTILIVYIYDSDVIGNIWDNNFVCDLILWISVKLRKISLYNCVTVSYGSCRRSHISIWCDICVLTIAVLELACNILYCSLGIRSKFWVKFICKNIIECNITIASILRTYYNLVLVNYLVIVRIIAHTIWGFCNLEICGTVLHIFVALVGLILIINLWILSLRDIALVQIDHVLRKIIDFTLYCIGYLIWLLCTECRKSSFYSRGTTVICEWRAAVCVVRLDHLYICNFRCDTCYVVGYNITKVQILTGTSMIGWNFYGIVKVYISILRICNSTLGCGLLHIHIRLEIHIHSHNHSACEFVLDLVFLIVLCEIHIDPRLEESLELGSPLECCMIDSRSKDSVHNWIRTDLVTTSISYILIQNIGIKLYGIRHRISKCCIFTRLQYAINNIFREHYIHRHLDIYTGFCRIIWIYRKRRCGRSGTATIYITCFISNRSSSNIIFKISGYCCTRQHCYRISSRGVCVSPSRLGRIGPTIIRRRNQRSYHNYRQQQCYKLFRSFCHCNTSFLIIFRLTHLL